MSGIVGFVNVKRDISELRNVLNKMSKTLTKRGLDEEGHYTSKHAMLGHKRLVITDLEGGKLPKIEKYQQGEYIITYNGQINNAKEIKEELSKKGLEFDSCSDGEILLKSYIYFGKDIVNHLNGAFTLAIFDTKQQELFIARDHLGIKPLFYTIKEESIIFASEIKAIFEFPGVEKIIDKQGFGELLGIGPAHTPGTTVFKNIYELKPAHFAVFNKSGLHIERYWKLKTEQHIDNFDKTCETIEYLLEDSINSKLSSDAPLCVFLSGGLDSSIIAKYAADYYKKQGFPPLKTFSIDYVDNDKNFVKSDFQPNSDNYYINLMTQNIYNEHETIEIDTPELADYLEDVMIARDMPGMADIDSSLLLFCKNVKKYATVSLTGECADEIFAGYPWFFREDALKSNTFPWSIAIEERKTLLHPEISRKIDLKEYIDFRYNESLNEVETLESDSKETAEKRKISHLTLNWFMQTLLDRSDRAAMYNGFEIRVPFCDYRLAQYLWNIPWEIKALNGREKGLLRHIAKKKLPEEIVERKKSPYPKTHNPTYLARVKNMLSDIMKDKYAPINNVLNREYILEILDTEGKAFTRPWFGQLMTGPQLMAYLCQVNMWLKKYQPKIEI